MPPVALHEVMKSHPIPRWLSRLPTLYRSTPLQLFLLHFRKNHFVLFSWVLFLLIFLQRIGNKLGIPYLFLDPEYLHRVDFLSFSLLGLSLGIFSLVFQITSYILYAARFPFFAFLKRPFLVFSVNNSLFPLFFHLFFAYGLISFHREQATGLPLTLINLSGYLAGVLLVALVFGLYFYLADEGPADKLTRKIDKNLRRTILAKVRSLTRWREAAKEKGKKRHFLTLCLSVRRTDQYPTDYDKKELLRVFDKNHLNVLLVGLLLVFFVLFLGKLADNSYLQLPVAVTFFVPIHPLFHADNGRLLLAG